MIQQPKPVPVNDLQGRLRCRCWSTEELITRQRRGFVLSICPSLALERERGRGRNRRRRGLLSLPRGLGSFHSRFFLVTFWPRHSSSQPSATALVYCPVMTLSTATMRPLITRCRPPWRVNGGVNGKATSSPLSSSEALLYVAVCAGER